MEDKINEIKKQMEDATKQMNEKMDPILNNYQSQINSLREQYNNRISELESQGFSSSDVYMDEQLIKLNNEITRLTTEADRVFEDLNKELDGKIADLNKQLEFEEDKARRIGEKNKELDSRMNELEQEGLSYGEMQMDPEVLRIQKEIEEISNEMSESEIKLIEQKEKEEKEEQEKNDAIKEYGDLKEQKAELESQLEEAKRELEEQNASLEKEKAEREAVMRQLEERHNTDVPEYKECEEDLRRIQELLDQNSNKSRIEVITKNIDDIDNRMLQLETKFGKDELEFVAPEPQPKLQPEPQPEQEPEPQPQLRRYGRRFNSEPQPSKQIPKDAEVKKEYDIEPLTSQDCFEIAQNAYDMMSFTDKLFIGNAMTLGEDFYSNMRFSFPEILKGNSEIEQRMICDALMNLYNHEFVKNEQEQQQEQPQEQPLEQPQVAPQSSPLVQPQVAPRTTSQNRPQDNLGNSISNIVLTDVYVDITTGSVDLYFSCNGKGKKVECPADERADLRISPKLVKMLKKDGYICTKNMDPRLTEIICRGATTLLQNLGVKNEEIDVNTINDILSQYEASVNCKDIREDELPMISYYKSDSQKSFTDFKGHSLEKTLAKYIRKSQQSPFVDVDENIDTRNWFEKLTDRVRSVFNPQKRIPARVAEAMRDHQDDPQLKTEEPEKQDKDITQQLHAQYTEYRQNKPTQSVAEQGEAVEPKEARKTVDTSKMPVWGEEPEQDDDEIDH